MRPRLLLAVLTLTVSDAFAQASLNTFTDRTAFLAATGATANGATPNLGPVDSATVGSLTFRPASMTASLYIGVGSFNLGEGNYDWYPPNPGNEIAMTLENLQVESAGPIFSLGFDFIEPKNTAQLWGGTPVNSTFKVTLYNGATQVGQFTFDAPDDVLAFVGVQSSQAFNKVVIFDTTLNEDDEYFGQFYTGTVPAAPRTFTAVARSGGAIPGAAGVFAAFPLNPAVRAGRIGFFGLGSAGQQGLYMSDLSSVLSPQPPPIKIADQTTAIPGGTGAFTGFGEMVLARVGTPQPPPIRIAFLGSGASQQGVYLSEVSSPIPPPIKVADLATAIPGGAGAFTSFSQVTASDSVVAFLGSGASQQGVYLSSLSNVSLPTPPPIKVADLATAIPGGVGSFTSFGELAVAVDTAQPLPPPIRVAFVGSGGSQQGVYLSSLSNVSSPNPPPIKVADLATAIPDGAGLFTGFGSLALAIDTALPQPPPIRVAFLGSGAGQQGVYLSEVPPNPVVPPNPTRIADFATPIPQGTGSFTGFSAVAAGGGHVAFLGTGSGGQAGIYLASALTKVIAAGDMLDGKSVTALRLGQFGLDGGSLTFAATFADGSQGVYSASVNASNFSGFFQPVDNLPVWNRVNAGQGVPVKFSLHGNLGLDIFAAGYPKSEGIPCDSSASVSGIEQTTTAGSSSLSYDSFLDQYTYAWKTEKGWSNTCRQLVVTLKDGSSHRANFTFK